MQTFENMKSAGSIQINTTGHRYLSESFAVLVFSDIFKRSQANPNYRLKYAPHMPYLPCKVCAHVFVHIIHGIIAPMACNQYTQG